MSTYDFADPVSGHMVTLHLRRLVPQGPRSVVTAAKGKPVDIEPAPPRPVPDPGARSGNEKPAQITGHPTKGKPK